MKSIVAKKENFIISAVASLCVVVSMSIGVTITLATPYYIHVLSILVSVVSIYFILRNFTIETDSNKTVSLILIALFIGGMVLGYFSLFAAKAFC